MTHTAQTPRERRAYRYPSGEIVTYERTIRTAAEIAADPLTRMRLTSAQIIGTDPGHGPSPVVGWIEAAWYAVDGTGSPIARRCASTYPGAVTLRGRAIRCESAAGHDGDHGHTFAARYWA